jgi:phosphoribosyl 1,2-cyclic phosphodiesterase
MRLVFLGTRGNIGARTRRHRMHSALMVVHGGRRVMIDCGADWAGAPARLAPHAIVVTHAHPDHAMGLRDGAPCPVYATAETWGLIRAFPISDRRLLPVTRAVSIAGVRFRAVPVPHSLRAPAVALRLGNAGDVLYAPDIAGLPREGRALRGVRLYIGDGASLIRPILRRAGADKTGHAPIVAQLKWCREAGVARAVFTHCGTQIVAGNARRVSEAVRMLGTRAGVRTWVAEDGDVLVLAADGSVRRERRGPAAHANDEA